ncbi:unnamed protein product [Prunus armeniaca]
MNKIVKKLLKRQLDKAKGAWPEKLPVALWAIQTSYRTATGETPFSMAFDSEVVVPVEIGEPSYRTEAFKPKANEEALALSLDLLEERRAQANLRNEAYKQRVSRYYDSRVRPRIVLGHAKGLSGNKESYGRNPWTFLGRTLRNHRYPAIGDLLTQRLQRKGPRSSLECRAFEILF